MRYLLIALMAWIAPSAWAQDPAGESFLGVWHGTLQAGPAGLRLELEVEAGEDGLAAVLVSLDQGGARMPATSAQVSDDTLRVEIAPAGLRITLTHDRADHLTGSFYQGAAMPFEMQRGRFPAGFTPPDLIGSDIEMSVASGAVSLAGSLRLPDGDAPFPAIVLLNGSGPQDRDATIAGHRVFGVLADALAERGIASLRLDDRGVGGSSAIAPDAPSDLADDAAAALTALAAREDIAACAGYIGHSEGGLIAFLAADAAGPDFILTLAGPAGTMREILYEQSEAIILASGGGQAGADANRALQEAMFDVMADPEIEDHGAAITAALIERGFPADAARQQAAIWGQAFAIASLDLDPAEAMAAYDGPVHAFFGERDLQVLAEPNAARLSEARLGLPTGITVIEGVNHLFQDAETGLPQEYASAPHAMSPRALDAIADAAEALIAQSCR